MPGAPIAFVDVETTGLDPTRHDVFEIALIVDGVELEWWPDHSVEHADPTALRMTRYYERVPEPDHPKDVAMAVAERTANRHLVGAVPSFDAAFLDVFLRRWGAAPAWHYHLVDVEALAAGKLGIEPPWDSEELSRAVGIDPDEIDRHTALGDARWAKAIYEAVLRKGGAG